MTLARKVHPQSLGPPPSAVELGEGLCRRMATAGFKIEQAWQELTKTFPDLRLHQLEDWLEGKQYWNPRVLYAFCDLVRHPKWVAADALGLLPEDPAAWAEARIVEGALSTIRRRLHQMVAAPDPVASVRAMLAKSLGHGYHFPTWVHQRGTNPPQDYQTYLAIVPPATGPRAGEEAESLRRRVDEALTGCSVYTHWEESSELKPDPHKDHLVLIVESFFANQGETPGFPESVDGQLGPIVVAGVYYTGAKDVVVLLHQRIGWAAIDVSRYVAEVLHDTEPFREELALQRSVFTNLVSQEDDRRIVVTIDDYKAMTGALREMAKGLWHRPRTATAFMLKADDALLDYAAFHIARTRGLGSRGRDQMRLGLQTAQEDLAKLCEKAFTGHYEVAVRLPTGVSKTVTGYPDAVDLLFDRYREVADQIEARLRRSPRRR
jgi:hypothetical protein